MNHKLLMIWPVENFSASSGTGYCTTKSVLARIWSALLLFTRFNVDALSLTFRDNGTVNSVLVKQQLTWPKARRCCREHHRDPVSIQSQDENNNILSTLTASGVANAWIGLYRDPWALGSDKSSSTFSTWNPGEPNNMLYYEYRASFIAFCGKWEDDICGGKVPFFCFKRKAWHANMNSLQCKMLIFRYGTYMIHGARVCLCCPTPTFRINVVWRNVQSHHSRKDDGE